MKTTRILLIVVSLALWGVCVVAGFQLLGNYANEPGEIAASPAHWPKSSALPAPASGSPSVLVFLHPQCPCSSATVEELDRALAISHNAKAKVSVVFVRPSGWTDKKVKSALWNRVAQIPRIHVRIDDGSEANRFRALTSGYVVAYDGNGALQFGGGITPSRGHQGDNEGRDRLAAFLAGEKNSVLFAKVFGCGLFGEARKAQVN